MTCEQVRWLLSLDPTASEVAHDAALQAHLDRCADCRAFARALATVDEALTARPLAQPRPGLTAAVVAAAQREPHASIEQPFPRPFVMLAAAVTLLALVSGALLLHYSSTALPAGSPAELWLNPSWAADASAWLSVEAEHAAQAVLPLIVGVVITIGAAAAGFRVSEQREMPQQPGRPRR